MWFVLFRFVVRCCRCLGWVFAVGGGTQKKTENQYDRQPKNGDTDSETDGPTDNMCMRQSMASDENIFEGIIRTIL